MDDILNLPEVQYSVDDSDYLRGGSEQSGILTVEDLSLLTIHDVEEARELVELYAESDLPRENVELFKQHLFQRSDSYFVQVGDVGLIYLTNVVPTFTANLQVIFWDRKFGKVRRELVQRVLATAIEDFMLTRIQAFVPELNVRLAQVELIKIGFKLEGALRKAWRETSDCDLLVFGLLAEEAKSWLAIPHLQTITSALRT